MPNNQSQAKKLFKLKSLLLSIDSENQVTDLILRFRSFQLNHLDISVDEIIRTVIRMQVNICAYFV